MTVEKNIGQLVKYNYWANNRIAYWLLSNKEEKLKVKCESSFTTIDKTINHIWDAQIFYLSVLKKIPFSKNSDKSIMGAINGLVSQSKEFVDYATELNARLLLEPREVKTKTLSGIFSQNELIQHCMNHSTFHRGQIITMGHQIELNKAPSTDLFFYLIKTREELLTT